jgi:hypothetical protein
MFNISDGVLSNPVHGSNGEEQHMDRIYYNNIILYKAINRYWNKFKNLFTKE